MKQRGNSALGGNGRGVPVSFKLKACFSAKCASILQVLKLRYAKYAWHLPAFGKVLSQATGNVQISLGLIGRHAGRAELEGPKETERQYGTGKQGFQNREAA